MSTLRERDPLQYFQKRSTVTPTGCWEWNLRRDKGGYGQMIRGNAAHRFAAAIVYGKIPVHLHVHHTCENRACVNPAHLVLLDTKSHNLAHADSIASRNSAKTHCPLGHPYDADNTYIDPRGRRCCRVCRAASQRRYMARIKETPL